MKGEGNQQLQMSVEANAEVPQDLVVIAARC